MKFVDGLVALAISQLGVAEATGSNDGIPSELYMGGRSEPWCGHFIAWLHRSIGYPLPMDMVPTPIRGNPLASVTFMEKMFKSQLGYRASPEIGDVLFLNVGMISGRPSKTRHMALVIDVHPLIKQFTTVGGNTGQKVAKVVYSRGNKLISGFGFVPNPEDLRRSRG